MNTTAKDIIASRNNDGAEQPEMMGRRAAGARILRTASGSLLAAFGLGACGNGSGSGASNIISKSSANNFTTKFIGTAFTDQDGNKFQPLNTNGAHLIVFGFNGCPACQEITQTLVAIRKKLPNIPITVVSVEPERDINNAKEYEKTYGEQGIAAYSGQKRILNIAFAPNGLTVEELQNTLPVIQDSTNRKNHTFDIVLCNGKDPVEKFPGLPAKVMGERFKKVDGKDVPTTLEEHGKETAEIIFEKANTINSGRKL